MLLTAALTNIAVAQRDIINETKETYNPMILPDNPMYGFSIMFEEWQIDHKFLLIPDDDVNSRNEKRVAFVQRRIIDTQRMIETGANYHAINNSITHMQIALMKLNQSTKEEISSFRMQIKDIDNNIKRIDMDNITSMRIKNTINESTNRMMKMKANI